MTDSQAQPTDVRKRLEADLIAAREKLACLEAEYAELLADSSTLQEDRDSVRLLLDAARRRVAAAEATFKRANSGGYGICVKCGGEIPPERLEALPDVTTCVACQA